MDRIESSGQLTAAREAAGLSIADVAHRLRLAPRQVAAIERGEWSALPGVAFARGVLRSYGRVLEVDTEPLVAEVAANLKSSELREVASLGQPLPRRSLFGFDDGGRGSKFVWATLAIIGVLALVLFFGGASLSSVRSWLDSSATAVSPGSSPGADGASGTGSASAPSVITPVPINIPQTAQTPPTRTSNRNRE